MPRNSPTLSENSLYSDRSRVPLRRSESIQEIQRRTRKRRHDGALHNSSRSAARPVGSTLSSIPSLRQSKFNLCFLCRQGGFVRTCDQCENFAACFSHENGMKGCLPSSFFYEDMFICPTCLKKDRKSLPYPLPTRSQASSHTGMDTSRLILLSVYLNDGIHFNSSVKLIESQLHGYYHAKESELLVLALPYFDLSGKAEGALIKEHTSKIREFKSAGDCRFLLVIQTHSDPSNGCLIYGSQKGTTLDVIINHVLPDLKLADFTQAILLLNTCGGYLQHHLDSLQNTGTSLGFSSIFAPDGPNVDPLLISKTLFYNVLDFYILGNETIKRVLKRCAQVDLLSHASVIAWRGGILYRLQGAALRFRPNGSDIRCILCDQPASYDRYIAAKNTIIFRCREPTANLHSQMSIPRKWAVKLVTSSDSCEVIDGNRGTCRSILTWSPAI